MSGRTPPGQRRRFVLLLAAACLCLLLRRSAALDTPTTLRYRIVEESPIGTFVGDVIGDVIGDVTNVTRPPLLLTVLSRRNVAHARYFSFERRTGVLRTRVRIDRDAVCAGRDACALRLHVAVHGGSSSEIFVIVAVVVTVDDVNDNAPSFAVDGNHVTRWVPEDAPPGTMVRLPRAEDLDGPRYGVQDYHVVRGPAEFELRVEGSVAYLVVRARLDREREASYGVLVSAVDGGDPPRSGTLSVTVYVADVNDNRPTFTRAVYTATVAEDLSPGATVAAVTATDRDSTTRLVYALARKTAHMYGRQFAVHATTGHIVLSAPLDYETLPVYHLVVTARERHLDSLPAECRVDIAVSDVNDNAPDITLNALTRSARVEVSEAASRGAFVAVLSVRDDDSGASGRATCHTDSNAFALSPLSPGEYKLQTSAVLDRERRSGYPVQVICVDGGIPPLTSHATFDVSILDVNDNAPTFNRSLYAATITENNDVTEFIVDVHATDADAGANGHVTYSIPDAGSRRLLCVHPVSGRVTARAVFDHEAARRLVVDVVASDNGVPPRRTTARISLTIEDANDEAPRFGAQRYRFSALENSPTGTVVGRLVADDADDPPYDHFRFVILRGEEEVSCPFVVDASSGRVTTTRPLDREVKRSFTVVVVVVDVLMSSLNSTTSVIIVVDDLNDNHPLIVFPADDNVTWHVSPEVPVGHVISTVAATDADVGRNAQLRYALETPDEFFVIDALSGDVIAKRSIAGVRGEIRNLRVRVCDLGLPVRCATRQINVLVNGSLPFNAHAPRLLSGSSLVIVVCIASASGVAAVCLLAAILALRKRERERNETCRLRKCSGDVRWYATDNNGHPAAILIPEARLADRLTQDNVKQLDTKVGGAHSNY